MENLDRAIKVGSQRDFLLIVPLFMKCYNVYSDKETLGKLFRLVESSDDKKFFVSNLSFFFQGKVDDDGKHFINEFSLLKNGELVKKCERVISTESIRIELKE